MYLTKISFPGLGIGSFEPDPVAFNLFGKNVYWYAIIICVGMILAMLYAHFNAEKSGLKKDDVLDLAIVIIPVAVVCARLFYVLTDDVKQKTFTEVIAVWDGGISIIGALIGGGIAVAAVALVKKRSLLDTLDLVVRCVLIGQIVGRIGNFINVEVYGIETALPWGMYIESYGYAVHPLFLYEMLWNLIGFVILHCIAKKKHFSGEIFFGYVAWYGLGRAFLELLRDPEYILSGHISHILAVLAFIIGAVCLVIFGIRAVRKSKHPEYTAMFNFEEEKAEEISEEENGKDN